MEEQELRNRSRAKSDRPSPPPTTIIVDDDEPLSLGVKVLDVVRVVLGLLLLNSILSYYVTSNSVFWNYRPRWTRPGVLRSYLTGPIVLTDAELLRYDGTDSSLPIYLAINSTIYDVSSSPANYGPGGSYHFFAGHDATRAYVTGCFDTDITWDLRGVEEMYMPVGDAPDEAALTSTERKLRHERERREARRMVEGAIRHWEGFFKEGKGGLYFPVGRVRREEGWEERTPVREVCGKALRARPKRDKGS